MVKNIIIVVLAVLCITLVGIRLIEPKEEPAAAPVARDTRPVAASDKPATPPGPAPARTPTPTPPPRRVETVIAEPPEPEPPRAAEPVAAAFDPGNILEMMDKPEFRKAMGAQQKLVMEQQYGELFDVLELIPEDRDTLKDLLAGRMVSDMELGIKAMQTAGTPDTDALEELKRSREEAQEQIRTFLGEEDFALFEQYEATQPERMQVDLFKQNLGPDNQLSWEQEHELIIALHEERMSFDFSTGLGDPQHTGGFPSPEQMERHMSEMRRLNEQYIARASELLTPTQAAFFRDNVDNMAAMQEMAFGMATKMFGEKPGAVLEPEAGSGEVQ